ncbi:MAG: 50S ribosomal protein L15 [Candidatus Bipolaricaulis sp.]|nr:50S ribosomal protein L15 [Candidatus Bipolaricaulis sp.]MDD5219336.1 50S ribosomal protein L15 [Candidatus Bipolaricaulis sp.]MDD5647172.1 50S ribosomal protein L15 [Candidatus Bipolaricaulis sp.]
MRLEDLRPTQGSTHRRKRVGRGYGSGRGGHESGRGTKGQNSRSGGGTRLGYEGGQTPIWMRVPKRGFHNYNRIEYACVNVDTLEARFEANEEVTPEVLGEMRLVRGRNPLVKVLGRGDLSKPLTVRAHRFGAEAKRKIEAAGGKAEVI